MKHFASALSVSLVAAYAASGQIVMDGVVDAGYGTALSVQNTNTGFGDSNLADPIFGNGSEIDAVYGVVEDGYLKLMITGNLESNFNKMEIFIDSEDGVGQNSLVGANLPTMVDGYCCTDAGGNFPDPNSGALQRMDGLTFDSGFAADYYLTMSHGTEHTGDPFAFPLAEGWIITAHYAELNNGTSGAIAALGGQLNAGGLEPGLSQGELVDKNNNDPIGTPLHEFFEPWDALSDPTNDLNHRNMENTIGLLMGFDNTNAYADDGDPITPTPIDGGVIGNGNTNDATVDGYDILAGQVDTGLEVAIPLAAIGSPTGDIKATIFINGTGHDYAANQFAGDGILAGNPGGDGAGGFTGTLGGVDLSAIAGDQFVTISQGSAIPGDLNGDGFVGLDDLDIILNHWNQTVTLGDPLQGDVTGPGGSPDGFVGLDDLDVLLNNWNAGTPPAPSAVPEPATLALLSMGGLAMLRRR